MKQLSLALYLEGPTDERFLPVIIQRAANRVLSQRALAVVEVIEPLVLRPSSKVQGNAERIFSVARQARGYDILIVHRDADARTPDRALERYFKPGLKLVQTSKEDVCRELIPIIPIRMTEAWMMADVEAFRDVAGTDLSAEQLGFPLRPRQVESIRDPKHELNMALDQIFARRRRRKRVRLGQYYGPLARRIRLDELDNVPAFRQFTKDLVNLLAAMRFI